MDKSFKPELKEYYHVRIRIDRGSGKYDDLHRFNLDQKSLLEEVVRKYEEEGVENFYVNGRRVGHSDSYAITIYHTSLEKVDINIRTDYDKLWNQVEKKGNEVTTEFIKIPSNPWRDTLFVCLKGHIINSSYKMRPEKNDPNCADCGSKAITECPNCSNPLPGDYYKPYFQTIGLYPRSYCTKCTHELPWTSNIISHKRGLGIESASSWLERTFTRFHSIVKSLEKRSRDRDPWKISDEYDLQYLVRAILHARFDDVREEEHTPSFTVLSNRMDFIIKGEGIVIETKMTREKLDDKVLSEQLIKDIVIYKGHQECKTLFFFIYDPGGKIIHPNSVKHDLENVDFSGLKVRVIIAP